MSPSKVLTDLIEAVLEWESADSQRLKVLDSKSASKADQDASNRRLVRAIKQLRVAAKNLKTLIRSKPKKQKQKINWFKVIDTVAGLSGALKSAKDQVQVPPGIDPKNVIDVEVEP